MPQDNFDEGFERPASSYFKFGKIGDVIKGTLIGVMEKPSKFKPGEMQKVYEIQAEAGQFHNIVDKAVQPTPTVLQAGDIWKVSGKPIIDNNMRRVETGRKVIMRYVGDFDNGKGNVAKTIEVKIGPMDPSYNVNGDALPPKVDAVAF